MRHHVPHLRCHPWRHRRLQWIRHSREPWWNPHCLLPHRLPSQVQLRHEAVGKILGIERFRRHHVQGIRKLWRPIRVIARHLHHPVGVWHLSVHLREHLIQLLLLIVRIHNLYLS